MKFKFFTVKQLQISEHTNVLMLRNRPGIMAPLYNYRAPTTFAE
jgi:hypothetical protein